MKYRPGDKVKVRSDLKINDKYEKYVVIKEMQKFSGKVVTIADCLWDGYSILEDNRDNGWTDEMFEDIKEDKMDSNTLQINMNNLSDEERNTLLSLVEKANKPVNKVWKPEDGEIYFYLFGTGSIHVDRWNNCDTDCSKYEIGNCFKTEKEAEFALERQKVITELKRYALEHNEKEIDWNSKIQNIYCLYYREHRGDIEADYFCSRLWDGVFFTSKKIAQAAIKAIGEDRLKKYYFEVND